MHHAVPDRRQVVKPAVPCQMIERFAENLVQFLARLCLELDIDMLRPFQELEAQRRASKVDHALADRFEMPPFHGEQADLDGRRTGVERDQQLGAHAAVPAASRSLRPTSNFARAAEAIRAASGSERLVSTIGTRAPSTIPAAVAPAK